MTTNSRRTFLKSIGLTVGAASASGGIAIAQQYQNADNEMATPTDWAMYRGGVGRTGASAQSGPSSQATTEWSMDLNGGMYATEPIIADGTLYLAVTTANSPSNNKGYIAAYDPASGTKKWQQSGFARPSTPALGGEGLYVATSTSSDDDSKGSFHALDPATGETKWSRQEYHSGTPPVVAAGRVYTDGPGASALDAASGKTVWKQDNVTGIASFANDTLFYSSGIALNAADGSKQWSVDTDTVRLHAVSDGQVYGVGKTDQGLNIQARSANNGTVQWTSEIADVQYTSHLTIANGRVFFRTGTYRSSEIMALDSATGDVAWTYESSDADIGSDVTVADGVLYAGGRTKPGRGAGEAIIVALDASSGERKWQHTLGSWEFKEYGPAVFTPVIANNKIFAATYPMGSTIDNYYTDHGNFHVIGDKNGSNGDGSGTTTTTTNGDNPNDGGEQTKTTSTSHQSTTATTTTDQPSTTSTTTDQPRSTTATNNTQPTTTPQTTSAHSTTRPTQTTTTSTSGQPGFEFLAALGGLAGVGSYLAAQIHDRDE
ncbi:PQQ-binding-like beta-propeller repeat protein [Halomicrococcus sp. NG-SE-24]|uniref:outer membrane protein assembly factor BamB family protein n=1 Tax=Halomicrococcus sp. NG-SE-24 TaxID=3436928 RepID=UPI003D99DD78